MVKSLKYLSSGPATFAVVDEVGTQRDDDRGGNKRGEEKQDKIGDKDDSRSEGRGSGRMVGWELVNIKSKKILRITDWTKLNSTEGQRTRLTLTPDNRSIPTQLQLLEYRSIKAAMSACIESVTEWDTQLEKHYLLATSRRPAESSSELASMLTVRQCTKGRPDSPDARQPMRYQSKCGHK